MSLISTVKEMLVPDTERGVQYECVECGERFEKARKRCPECGEREIMEVEGFDMRPDT
ncbi:hypothetical protein [Halopelagius fulvigenes]|uniref:DUF35 domain-containing protein n=1 Tax=Halopelagius fulvigenes TaxID=1198324 RepID=A0ABD5U6P4_9EURY